MTGRCACSSWVLVVVRFLVVVGIVMVVWAGAIRFMRMGMGRTIARVGMIMIVVEGVGVSFGKLDIEFDQDGFRHPLQWPQEEKSKQQGLSYCWEALLIWQATAMCTTATQTLPRSNGATSL
jgi:hypothetical protein